MVKSEVLVTAPPTRLFFLIFFGHLGIGNVIKGPPDRYMVGIRYLKNGVIGGACNGTSYQVVFCFDFWFHLGFLNVIKGHNGRYMAGNG
jgi:hypothetical protein